MRVPCVMRWPSTLPKGKVTSQVGITMDLTATFLAAAGFVKDDATPLDGIDLTPILTGKQKEADRTLFWRIDRAGRKQKSVREGNWKYLKDDMIELLFDLSNDVEQRRNLVFRQPETVQRLRRLLDAWEIEMDKSEREFLVK